MSSAASRSRAGRKAAEARHAGTRSQRLTCSAKLPDGTICGARCRSGRRCNPHRAEYERERRKKLKERQEAAEREAARNMVITAFKD